MSNGEVIGGFVGFLVIAPFIIGMWAILFLGLRSLFRRYW